MNVFFGMKTVQVLAKVGAVIYAHGAVCPSCGEYFYNNPAWRNYLVGWAYVDDPKNIPGAVVVECHSPLCRKIFYFYVTDDWVYKRREEGHPLFSIIKSHEYFHAFS